MKSVFVFTPLYRFEPETREALFALEWDGPIAWHLQRDNPFDDGRMNITHQYQEGRKAFLASGYDGLLVIESDIIPPADTIRRLAALLERGADAAYGHYVFRNQKHAVSNIFERYPGTPRNEGESLSVWPRKYEAAMRAGIVPCSGAGLGCVLLKRHVLERFDFWHKQDDGGHCDVWFNRDVLRAGLVQMADMFLMCGHKCIDGTVLWPKGHELAHA